MIDAKTVMEDQKVRDRFINAFTAVVDRALDTMLSLAQPGNVDQVIDQAKQISTVVSKTAYDITAEGKEFQKATAVLIDRFGVAEYYRLTGADQIEPVTQSDHDVSFAHRLARLIH